MEVTDRQKLFGKICSDTMKRAMSWEHSDIITSLESLKLGLTEEIREYVNNLTEQQVAELLKCENILYDYTSGNGTTSTTTTGTGTGTTTGTGTDASLNTTVKSVVCKKTNKCSIF